MPNQNRFWVVLAVQVLLVPKPEENILEGNLNKDPKTIEERRGSETQIFPV